MDTCAALRTPGYAKIFFVYHGCDNYPVGAIIVAEEMRPPSLPGQVSKGTEQQESGNRRGCAIALHSHFVTRNRRPGRQEEEDQGQAE